jgi:hypothetical protein
MLTKLHDIRLAARRCRPARLIVFFFMKPCFALRSRAFLLLDLDMTFGGERFC